MSRRKTERLLNLVVCLLATRRYLTAEQIRQAVPGYPEGTEAFKRMFERDKEELRELGIPLETGSDGDEEAGYRIQRQAYELPEITAEPRRGGGARPGRAGLAARQPRRGGLRRAAEAARRRRRHRRGRLPRASSRGSTPTSRRSRRCGARCATGAR